MKKENIIKVDVMRNGRFLFTYRYKYCPLFIINVDDIRNEIEEKFPWLKNQKYNIML